MLIPDFAPAPFDYRATSPCAIEQCCVIFPSSVIDISALSVAQVGKDKRPANAVIDRVPWSISVDVDLKRLSSLVSGWDGRGSVAISKEALRLAEVFLRTAVAANEDAAAPAIVPTGDGSIQIEWHRKHGELEFLIEADGCYSIWGRDYLNASSFEDGGEEAASLFYRWAPWMAATPHETDVFASTPNAYLQVAA